LLPEEAICMIPKSELTELENYLIPFIYSGLQGSFGEMNPKDVLEEAKAGTMQLWAVIKNKAIFAVITTQIAEYPQYKECIIVTLAGRGFSEYAHLVSVIESWAKQEGCRSTSAYTRRGFVKALKQFNFHEAYTIVRKELGDVNEQENSETK